MSTILKWEINGDSMTAWASDLVMYEISPDLDSPLWFPHKLTINKVAEAQSTHLGWFHRLAGAQQAAQRLEEIAAQLEMDA
jgi:hypothetical protein